VKAFYIYLIFLFYFTKYTMEVSGWWIALLVIVLAYCLLAVYRLYKANYILYFHRGDENAQYTAAMWEPLRNTSYTCLQVRTNDFDLNLPDNVELAGRLGISEFPTMVKVTHFGLVEKLPLELTTEQQIYDWAKQGLETAKPSGFHLRKV